VTSQEHISRQDFQALQAKPAKRQKYNAKRVLLDGICFDSKAESRYYAELKIRERQGEVTDIELQRRFDLMVNGSLAAVYVADFCFFDRLTRCRRVVDVKGAPVTRDFRIKQNLMKSIFAIDVEVVRMK
jgi:hypothetical protein